MTQKTSDPDEVPHYVQWHLIWVCNACYSLIFGTLDIKWVVLLLSGFNIALINSVTTDSYLIILFMRLAPPWLYLSGICILLSVADNCPTSIRGRERIISSICMWPDGLKLTTLPTIGSQVDPYHANIFCPDNAICLLHLLHIFKSISDYFNL